MIPDDEEDLRTPREVLRDLYSAMLPGINSCIRRFRRQVKQELTLKQLEDLRTCIERLEPLLDPKHWTAP